MQYIIQFLPMIAIFAMMYFFMIRPQQKQMKEKAQMIANLQPGQEVIMIGGLHGLVDEVNQAEGTIVLNCEGIYLTYELNAVAKVNTTVTTERTSVDELAPSTDDEEEKVVIVDDQEMTENN